VLDKATESLQLPQDTSGNGDQRPN
jgi:hypothetical protein